jgi:hypothetical protein
MIFYIILSHCNIIMTQRLLEKRFLILSQLTKYAHNYCRFNRIQNEQVHKVLKAKELGNALDNPSSSNDGRRIF